MFYCDAVPKSLYILIYINPKNEENKNDKRKIKFG